jgi:rubrerythrin
MHNVATKKKSRSSRTLQEPMEEKESRAIFWTHCADCGDTWTARWVLQMGKCPICGGKAKSQKRAF